MLSPYTATRAEHLKVVRPFLRDAATARDAFEGAVTVSDVERVARMLAGATHRVRPAWYREDRKGDAYACTLDSGEVLAWARFADGEPLELMAWADEYQGSILWREKPSGQRPAAPRR